MRADELVREVVDTIERELRDRLPDTVDDIDAEKLGAEATDWLLSALQAVAGPSPVGRRIGPVYTTDDLARWLVPPGRARLTTQAVRKRAKEHRLVAFLTDDQQWAFPAWQFDRVAGRLMPRIEVVRLWRQLPHEGFLPDADLVAWMNTRFDSLQSTPWERADRLGAGDQALRGVVSRLRSRAA